MQYKVGDVLEPFQLIDINKECISIPNKKIIHFQFRRFAACPICNLHIHEFSNRHAELEAVGIQEVIFFHATDADMKKYNNFPFHMISDPNKKYYRDFGVETSWLSILNPLSWWSGVKGLFLFPGIPHNEGQGHLGLPADFLINSDGKLIALKYGKHADDHWSVDELIKLQQIK